MRGGNIWSAHARIEPESGAGESKISLGSLREGEPRRGLGRGKGQGHGDREQQIPAVDQRGGGDQEETEGRPPGGTARSCRTSADTTARHGSNWRLWGRLQLTDLVRTGSEEPMDETRGRPEEDNDTSRTSLNPTVYTSSRVHFRTCKWKNT